MGVGVPDVRNFDIPVCVLAKPNKKTLEAHYRAKDDPTQLTITGMVPPRDSASYAANNPDRNSVLLRNCFELYE